MGILHLEKSSSRGDVGKNPFNNQMPAFRSVTLIIASKGWRDTLGSEASNMLAYGPAFRSPPTSKGATGAQVYSSRIWR